MQVAIIGSGYVRGSAIYEYGMNKLMQKARYNSTFTTSFAGIGSSKLILIALGTPFKNSGDADLGFVESVATEIGKQLDGTNAAGLICELLSMGAFIKVYDPMARDNYQKKYPDLPVEYAADWYGLAEGCDALVLLTEREQSKNADWSELRYLMKRKILIDGSNLFDPQVMSEQGLVASGIGSYLQVTELDAMAPKVQ